MKWSPFKPGSTESNGLMFTKISGLVDGHNCLFTSLSFFNFSTTLPWQPIKVKKIGVFPGPIYFVALPFRNRLQYRNSNFKRLNTMNFSTLFFDILWWHSVQKSQFMLLTITPLYAFPFFSSPIQVAVVKSCGPTTNSGVVRPGSSATCLTVGLTNSEIAKVQEF